MINKQYKYVGFLPVFLLFIIEKSIIRQNEFALGKLNRLFIDGEEETLKIDINQPQELYLRGFVPGLYVETYTDQPVQGKAEAPIFICDLTERMEKNDK